jgi:hypothetical protein
MALLAWGIFSVLTFSINKFKTTISILLGIVLSSAWLVSYFSAKKELLLSTYVGYHLEASYIFTNFFHGVSVIILLFLAFRSRDQSHPLSGWWTGHAVLGVITLLGIPAIIPFFNQPHQVTYATYFFLIGIHGILRAHTMFTRGIIHRAVPLFVLLFLLTSVYSAVKFADFAEKRDIHTMYGSEIDTLPSFIKSPLTCYPECGGELSYWVINHNISTTDNLSPEATPISIARNREELSRGIETGDCTTIYSSLQKLQTKTLLVYPVFCPALQACGFSTQKTSRWCITTTP